MRFSVIDRGDEFSSSLVARIIEVLNQNNWIFDDLNPDIVICVGGDGTILRGIHKYLDNKKIPLFTGIHTGTLGFLTDYKKSEFDEFLDDILNKEPEIVENKLLEITFPQISKTVYALNEVRIESLGKSLSLDVYIDGEFFENCNGSGICVSTQAGSTAVNRGLSGAVVDDQLSIMQLCEILPLSHKNHHSLMNPYIMNDQREIVIVGSVLSYVQAYYDHLSMNLDGISEIHIKTSEKKVRFARYRTYSYLKRLKNLY